MIEKLLIWGWYIEEGTSGFEGIFVGANQGVKTIKHSDCNKK